MPAYYQYNCDGCNYSARRYRNVRRCKCGGNLIREEPQATPNRVVIEVWDDGAWGFVRAEHPDEVVIIMHPILHGYDVVYGEDHIPIKTLGVADVQYLGVYLEERKDTMPQEKLILERTIELLVAAGHVTEGQVEKASKLAIGFSPTSVGETP